MSSIPNAPTHLLSDNNDENKWFWNPHGRCLIDRDNAISVQFLLDGDDQTIRYPLSSDTNTYNFGVITSDDGSMMHLRRIYLDPQVESELLLSAPSRDQNIHFSVVNSREPCRVPTRVTEYQLGPGDSVSLNVTARSHPSGDPGPGNVFGQAARRQGFYVGEDGFLHGVDMTTRRR